MRQFWLAIFIVVSLGSEIHAQAEDEDVVIQHAVVAGENLTSIANTYGLTVDDITAANDIDPDAFLQVGQRLRIVFPAAQATAEPEATAAPTSAPIGQVESEEQIVPTVLANDLPSAPVARADAPRQDLSLLDPEICFALFLDENRNSILDPGEELMSGGEVSLSDGGESVVYAAEDSAVIYCIEDLQRQIYTITAKSPADYSLTGSATLRIDLRDGMPLDLYFGVASGLIQPEPAVAAPPVEQSRDDAQVPESVLDQISGLFAWGLAAIVLATGLMLALFMRLR